MAIHAARNQRCRARHPQCMWRRSAWHILPRSEGDVTTQPKGLRGPRHHRPHLPTPSAGLLRRQGPGPRVGLAGVGL